MRFRHTRSQRSKGHPDERSGKRSAQGRSCRCRPWFYSIGMTSDMDLASEDATTRKKGVAFLQEISRAMKQMGGSVMAGINYSCWPRKLFPGEDKKILIDRSVEGVREAIKTAEDCGVIFCVEV